MRVLAFPGSSNETLGNSIATIGVFDGVHIGHRSLLLSLVERAKKFNKQSIVITFDPHPQTVLGQFANPVKLLTGLPDRLGLIGDLQIDVTIVCRFTRELSLLTGEQFLRALTDQFGIKDYLLGPNHAFGYKRSGNRDTLPEIARNLDIAMDWVEPTLFEGKIASSTWIRSLLTEGDFAKANSLLGRPYHLSGLVVAGDQRGRTLGVPTANVLVEPPDKLIPNDGVYFASTTTEGVTGQPTVLSIGTRPTFGNLSRAVEAHILDFSGDLYGRRIQLDLHQYLRPQLTFGSVDELIARMHSDIDKTRQFFSNQSV